MTPGQAVDARNAVAHFDHAADLSDRRYAISNCFNFPAGLRKAISSALNFMGGTFRSSVDVRFLQFGWRWNRP